MHAFCYTLEFADQKKNFSVPPPPPPPVGVKLRKATLCGRALQVVPIRHNADTTQGWVGSGVGRVDCASGCRTRPIGI